MFKMKSKKAQSAIEMCICIPIFMVCIFGAFDLTLMVSGLLNTMIVARDSVREMSLIDKKTAVEVQNETTKIARAFASRSNERFISIKPENIKVTGGNPTHNSPQLVQVCSEVHLLVPWMWGYRNNQPMKICASYYMIRQFKTM